MTPDELAAILDELGRRLGPAGERVFELAVRQVYVNALTAAVLSAAWVLFGVLVGRRLLRWIQDGDYHGDRDMVGFGVVVTWAAVGIMFLIWAVITIPTVLNPEYAALRDILSTVGRVR